MHILTFKTQDCFQINIFKKKINYTVLMNYLQMKNTVISLYPKNENEYSNSVNVVVLYIFLIVHNKNKTILLKRTPHLPFYFCFTFVRRV